MPASASTTSPTKGGSTKTRAKRSRPVAGKHSYDRVYRFDHDAGFWPVPKGATALDFAFALDPRKALYCIGVKVNGRPAELGKRLSVGDEVEFITANQKQVALTWLANVHEPATLLVIHGFGGGLSGDNLSAYTELMRISSGEPVKRKVKAQVQEAAGQVTDREGYKQPGREGKKLIGAYIDVAEAELLKSVLKARGTTVQDFFAEAVSKAIAADIGPAERDRLIEAQVARYRATLRATLKK